MERPTEAVLFDGDGTLWEVDPAVKAALQLVLEELWSRRPHSGEAGLGVDRLIGIRDRVADELVGRVPDRDAVQLSAFERMLEEIGTPDAELASELASSYFGHVHRMVRLAGGVRPVLHQLAASYRLGLISTVDPKPWGLADRFAVVVDPGTRLLLGGAPLGEIRDALAALDTPPERVCYVSGSQEALLAGAERFGVTPVWLRPHAAGRKPSRVTSVRDLAELLAAISNLAGKSITQ